MSFRRAAKMPAAMASGMVMISARMASFADRKNACPITEVTGLLCWNESPKSNVTVFLSSRTYCTGSGSFVPRRSLIWSTVSCGANGPAMLRPTSLGSTLTMTKTIVTMSHKVTMASSTRRTT